MTEITLKELVTSEFVSLRRELAAMDRRHVDLSTARDKAVDAALAAANEKAQAHNDVLTAMKDQQAKFVTKDQAAMQFKGLAIAITALTALITLIVTLVVFSQRGAP